MGGNLRHYAERYVITVILYAIYAARCLFLFYFFFQKKYAVEHRIRISFFICSMKWANYDHHSFKLSLTPERMFKCSPESNK